MKFKQIKYEHWCGCVTEGKDDAVYFQNICQLHQYNKKHRWIPIQHPEEEREE